MKDREQLKDREQFSEEKTGGVNSDITKASPRPPVSPSPIPPVAPSPRPPVSPSPIPPVTPSPRRPFSPSPTPPVTPSPRPPVTPSPRHPIAPSGQDAPQSPIQRWRNAILGTVLIIAGLAAALVTIIARHTNETGVATAAAVLSLVIAGLILVFVVPPLARSAKLEVAQLNLPVEITTGGGIFLVILVVVAFAAWNTGNNLLFLVFSLLCSTLFVSWVAARASLHDLVVSARFPDHIFAGEAAPVIVTLRNLKRVLPSFSVLVEARGPIELANGDPKRRKKKFQKRLLAYFTYVPRRASAEQRVEQLFPHRGHVLINGFELSTRFPFGFVRRRRRLRARNVDIVVYPKPESISDKLHLLPTYTGRMPSIRRGAGQDLFSLRDYQPRDDLRHIHWKATARTTRLTVREFTSEDERRITIVLDTRRLPNIEDEEFNARFERGVSQAASLVKHFIDERSEVRLILGGEPGMHGEGIEHLYVCLRRLALVKPEAIENNDKLFSDEADSEDAAPIFQDDYAIVLTFAQPGSIPAPVWRSSHVIFL